MGQRSSGKDSNQESRSTSYAQSVTDGQSTRTHWQEQDEFMMDGDVIMDISQNEAAIDDDSKELCDKLLDAVYDHPKDTLFGDDTLVSALRRVQAQKQAWWLRDITPCLVPSAELPYICNDAKLAELTDDFNEPPDKSKPVCGPHIKPDFVAGLASSAFTAKEIQHLKKDHTYDSPSYITADMYFPFLICEAKCGELGMSEAERRAMQRSSIAIKAVVELYRKVSRAHELDHKILAFSISHTHRMVRIHGHYACTTGAKTRYFRHLLHSSDFIILNGKYRWTAYDFTRSVYDQFVPEHMERIRSVLTELSERPPEAFMSLDSIDGDTKEPSLQEVPRTPQTA